MKKVLLSFVVGLFLSSCVSNIYYQVYKVQPINNLSKSSSSLIYEDANCNVLYDFWGEGGSVGFLLYNKSDKDIYVNMKESFFILNGIAYDYYKNSEYSSFNSISLSSAYSTSQSSMYNNSATNSYNSIEAIIISVAGARYNYSGFKKTNNITAGIGTSQNSSHETSTTSINSSSTSTQQSKSSGFSVYIKEKDIICIPSKSAKVISEYNINKSSLHRDCNLFLHPSKNQIRTSHFSEDNTPFVFSNRITYTIESIDKPIKMEHKFYVSEITNYSYMDITMEQKTIDSRCEDEKITINTSKKIRYFKDVAPDKFYIKYSKIITTGKH